MPLAVFPKCFVDAICVQRTMTVDQWMTAFPAMFIFLLIAIYGLLKIPALTNHLFSGAAGADSGLAAAMVAYVSRG